MFNDFKSRLVLIFLLIGIACYFLIPTYNKYFTTSNYEIIFNSPDKSTSIPIGAGILLEVNESVDKACLSNFEFYSDDNNHYTLIEYEKKKLLANINKEQ